MRAELDCRQGIQLWNVGGLRTLQLDRGALTHRIQIGGGLGSWNGLRPVECR